MLPTEPPKPTKKEIWIEDRIEELCDIDHLINYTWFENCIDWNKVVEYLTPIAEEDYDTYIMEKQIARMEDLQRWDDE